MTSPSRFRVSPVMTTSISLHNYDAPVCIIIMELDEKWLGVAESTSHSQLEGRGACSPDAELANPRQRRDISYRCILYIFDFVLEGCPVMSCCGTQNLSLAFARQILTAATPFCSLYLPQAALANVPTSNLSDMMHQCASYLWSPIRCGSA